MAAVMSDWIRSRRFTGIGTCGRDRPGSSPVWDLALGRPCVLLALCFLALPLHARLLVVLAATSLGEDAGLLDLLVEAAEGALERLVLTHSDFSQSGIHLPGLEDSARFPARGPTSSARPRWGRRSVAQGPGRVKRPADSPVAPLAPLILRDDTVGSVARDRVGRRRLDGSRSCRMTRCEVIRWDSTLL